MSLENDTSCVRRHLCEEEDVGNALFRIKVILVA